MKPFLVQILQLQYVNITALYKKEKLYILLKQWLSPVLLYMRSCKGCPYNSRWFGIGLWNILNAPTLSSKSACMSHMPGPVKNIRIIFFLFTNVKTIQIIFFCCWQIQRNLKMSEKRIWFNSNPSARHLPILWAPVKSLENSFDHT